MPQDIESSHSLLKVIGVFNPGVARYKGEIILLVRVAEAARHSQAGVLLCPRAVITHSSYSITLDRLPILDASDKRKPKVAGGLCRLSYISHLEIVCLSPDGYTVKSVEKHPHLFPMEPYEEFGLEDARITEIDGTYYITYVAVSRQMSVCTALLSTTDFTSFHRHGIIFDTETKDVAIFPRRIYGYYAAYLRPTGGLAIRKPAILMAKSPDLIHWGDYQYVLGSRSIGWDSAKVGTGTPPILTDEGWLSLYHGVEKGINDEIGNYSVGAYLTAPGRSDRLVAKTTEPLLTPNQPFEKEGFVPNVIFPCGMVIDENNSDHLIVYYGAADTGVAAVTISLSQLKQALALPRAASVGTHQ